MWKESYAIGVKEIDDQHKELCRVVGNLIQASHRNELTASFCMDTLAYLKSYTVKHFADEEAYQQRIGYAGLEAHKKIHVKLIENVLAHEEALFESSFDKKAVENFLGFVVTWLVNHIGEEDQQIPRGAKVKTPGDNQGAVENYALTTIDAFNLMAGTNENMRHSAINAMPFKSELCYSADLHAEIEKAVGIVYTEKFAFNIFEAMTDIKIIETNEIVLSMLCELTNIVCARIAAILASKSGYFCEIGTPVTVFQDTIKIGGEGFLLNSNNGDVVVSVFNK